MPIMIFKLRENASGKRLQLGCLKSVRLRLTIKTSNNELLSFQELILVDPLGNISQFNLGQNKVLMLPHAWIN